MSAGFSFRGIHTRNKIDRRLMMVPSTFKLGEYNVICTPAPDPNNYMRYEIYKGDVLIRAQITYPEAADCHLGSPTRK